MGGVKPLRGREKLRTPPEPARKEPRASGRERAFVLEERGDDVDGRAEDVARSILLDLRAGRIPPERDIDLHGERLAAASRKLAAAVAKARKDGVRCVLVIHGRGLHSDDEPVLKRALPEWLQAPPHAAIVQAFATAPQGMGGPGASLVLLRRERAR